MTLGFMAIYAIVLHERLQLHRVAEFSLDISQNLAWLAARSGYISESAAASWLSDRLIPHVPTMVEHLPTLLVILGMLSVFYWQWVDDLRPYSLVQFFSLITIPMFMHFFPAIFSHQRHLYVALGWYAAAKVAEVLDKQIYKFTCRMLFLLVSSLNQLDSD
jgi:hypothetical protein